VVDWLRRILYAWLCNIAALFVAALFIDGVDYSEDFWILVVAALVYALVNLLLKPIVKLLALPLIVVTFGIALFFVNILMLYITDWIVPSFELESFGAAVAATVVVWAVNFVLYAVFDLEDRRKNRR